MPSAIDPSHLTLLHADEAIAYVESTGELVVVSIEDLECWAFKVGACKGAVKSLANVGKVKGITGAVQRLDGVLDELRARRNDVLAGAAAHGVDGRPAEEGAA